MLVGQMPVCPKGCDVPALVLPLDIFCLRLYSPQHPDDEQLPHARMSGLTMPPSKHSMGTYQEPNSHATRQGTFGHSRPSSLSHCGLILAERVE